MNRPRIQAFPTKPFKRHPFSSLSPIKSHTDLKPLNQPKFKHNRPPLLHKSSLQLNNNKIEVYCRIKPTTDPNILRVFPDNKTVICSDEQTRGKSMESKYLFTNVFRDQDQEEIVETICQPILRQKVKGALIFAYGVTNSGKTYTIIGSKEKPGVLLHLLERLPKPLSLFSFEIYNDNYYCLNSKRAKIEEKSYIPKFELSNLRPEVITEKTNVYNVLDDILKYRTTDSTPNNHQSSRSHTIFKIELIDGRIITIVDLAGSERYFEGQNSKEGRMINKSLLTLGRCIKSLGEQKEEGGAMIPFRESKLTKALSEYFTNEFKISMILTVNPVKNLSDTKKVLEYAAIAKSVEFLQPPIVVPMPATLGPHPRLLRPLKHDMDKGQKYFFPVNQDKDLSDSEISYEASSCGLMSDLQSDEEVYDKNFYKNNEKLRNLRFNPYDPPKIIYEEETEPKHQNPKPIIHQLEQKQNQQEQNVLEQHEQYSEEDSKDGPSTTETEENLQDFYNPCHIPEDRYNKYIQRKINDGKQRIINAKKMSRKSCKIRQKTLVQEIQQEQRQKRRQHKIQEQRSHLQDKFGQYTRNQNQEPNVPQMSYQDWQQNNQIVLSSKQMNQIDDLVISKYLLSQEKKLKAEIDKEQILKIKLAELVDMDRFIAKQYKQRQASIIYDAEIEFCKLMKMQEENYRRCKELKMIENKKVEAIQESEDMVEQLRRNRAEGNRSMRNIKEVKRLPNFRRMNETERY